LRDDLIVEIARRQPNSEHDLAVIRGVNKHDLAGLLAAIETGCQLPKEEWPDLAERDNDPPQVALIASFLLAALGSYCAEQRLTLSIAATSNDVKQLVRDSLANTKEFTDGPLHRGWRAIHVLPFLRSLLEGRRAMLIGETKSNAPFDFVVVNKQ
jgi:ribonuclease D